jgi:hypothetical protein
LGGIICFPSRDRQLSAQFQTSNPIRGTPRYSRSAARQRSQDRARSRPRSLSARQAVHPDAGATWLLTELDPGDPDIAFGLCDLGLGYPELGTVSLDEIAAIRGGLGLPVERDTAFVADRPLSHYAEAAIDAGFINSC